VQSPLSLEKYFTDSQNIEGWDSLDWVHLAQNLDEWLAVVNNVMNFWVPKIDAYCMSSLATGSFSRRILLHEATSLVIKGIPH